MRRHWAHRAMLFRAQKAPDLTQVDWETYAALRAPEWGLFLGKLGAQVTKNVRLS